MPRALCFLPSWGRPAADLIMFANIIARQTVRERDCTPRAVATRRKQTAFAAVLDDRPLPAGTFPSFPVLGRVRVRPLDLVLSWATAPPRGWFYNRFTHCTAAAAALLGEIVRGGKD